MPFPKRFLSGLFITLTVAGLIAGCSSPAPTTTVEVSPGKSASLRMAGGLEVTIPGGAVTQAGALSGSVITAPTAAPPGMTLAGPVYDLHLTGTVLRGHADLTVPVPAPRAGGVAAGPSSALLVYYDAAAGTWQPAAASYNPATRTLSATVGHLSVWSLLQINPQQILDAMHSALLGFLGVANSPRPDCPGSSSLASSGVQVTADTGDLVSWCPDVTSTGVVLRIVSKRTYALEASYLSDWSATLAGPVDPVTSAILKGIPVITPRASGPGVHTSIIPGGTELDVQPQPGASGRVIIGPSGEGIFIDALTYAATTLAMVYGRLPATAASTAVKTSGVISDMFTDSACVKELSAAYGNPDISTSQAAGGLFRSLTDVAASCLAKYWPKVYQVSGPSAAFIASVLLWAADGIKLIVTDGHAIIDSAVYWQGYNIYLRSISVTGVDWNKRQYALTCDNIVQTPVDVAFSGGKATARGPGIGSYDRWDLSIDQVTHGVLPSLGNVTAVLFSCGPWPSNFSVQELRIYHTANGSEIGRIPALPANGGVLPGVFKPGSVTIANGHVSADVMFYGPGDSHASGPSVPGHMSWSWNGQEFITDASPGTACPDSAQLLSAWNAAPAAIRQSWVGPQVTGFAYISCWHDWVVAEPMAVSPGNGDVVFSQMGSLHLITVTELQQQFRSAVCSAPDAPPGWKGPPLISCN